MPFHSLAEIEKRSREEEKSFFQIILEDDISERKTTKEASMKKMEAMWNAMLDAADAYDPQLRSNSGLVGKDGGKMEAYREQQETLCGPFASLVITQALQMGESNACMKRIVAAPTAGACGVLPAVLIPYHKTYRTETNEILEALYVAAGIGQVIATRAFIAGAAGGCQAEVGTASAMAAGALCSLRGGEPEQISAACGMALKNLLGLVCDPVAGLVEVPCVKRNVIGAMNALASADMALAGIRSAIPTDQVIDAMREVGEKMDVSLRETGMGGLAATPAGQEITRKMKSRKF